MSIIKQAESLFNEGYLCSQAVLSAYCQDLGLDRETALKVTGVFGGGTGIGGPCGAVTAAFMVIGLKYGNVEVDDIEAKKKAYNLAREFVQLFKSRNGSIMCSELLGCDLGSPEGIRFAKSNNLFKTICPKYVRDAAEILAAII